MGIYEEFSVILTKDKIYEDPTISYADICRELKIRPTELDSVLISELGYSGEELIEEYRKKRVVPNSI